MSLSMWRTPLLKRLKHPIMHPLIKHLKGSIPRKKGLTNLDKLLIIVIIFAIYKIYK